MGRLGLMIGVIGWYAHWAAWLAIADAGSFTGLLGDPQAMWGFAALVAEHEVRSVAATPGRQPKRRMTRLQPIRRSWSRPSTTEMPDAHCLTSS